MFKNRSLKFQGICCILMAAFFFCLMSLFVRLSGDLPVMEKAFFRNAIAALVALVMLLRTEEKFRMGKGNLPYLLLRSGFGTAGIVANFYAIDHMAISDANMLNKLSPFFAIIMSYFILKEKASKKEWLAVVVAFAGALLVIKPSFTAGAIPAFVGVFGGFAAGVAYTFVRKLGKRGERGPLIVFFFSTFSTLFVLPFVIADFQPMTGKQLMLLLAAGIAAAGGQLSITAAYSKAPAKEISVFDYSQILFAAILGFLFLGELPDIWSFLGYIVIIGAAVWRMQAMKEKC
ncbi:MAG: DMT family transporter [Lachnospiraceae bacterium]|nr:DMT family transporter [Lachnospiraceae bacterium]